VPRFYGLLVVAVSFSGDGVFGLAARRLNLGSLAAGQAVGMPPDTGFASAERFCTFPSSPHKRRTGLFHSAAVFAPGKKQLRTSTQKQRTIAAVFPATASSPRKQGFAPKFPGYHRRSAQGLKPQLLNKRKRSCRKCASGVSKVSGCAGIGGELAVGIEQELRHRIRINGVFGASEGGDVEGWGHED